MSICIKRFQPFVFALFLGGLSGLGAQAKANEVPALRGGAVVCDLDPDTGKRAVYLPAIWHDITETMANPEAASELVYEAAVFHKDGTLVKEVRTYERVIPNYKFSRTRAAILAPERTGEILPDGRLLSSDGIQIDEAFNLKRLDRKSAFRIREKMDYWEMAFQEFLRARQFAHDRAMAHDWRRGHLSTLPRVIAPDVSWFQDFTQLKIDADIPVSILVEPAEISYPSEQDNIDQWEAYAKTRLRKNRKSYSCAGSTLVIKDLGADFYPKKTDEDIGIRTPIIVTPPKIRYFNIFGTEIK